MMALTPNVSSDQTIPFDDVRAASLIQEFHTIIDGDDVYSVMNYGSVQFVSEPSTSLQQKQTLTECIAHAHSQGKTKFVVFNGANDSTGKDGTTFTSSNWVEDAANNYSQHPKYNTMEFYCYGLAPHSTAHMKSVWMEEYGNTHTKTYIITLSAKERQKMLSIFGSKCSKVILNEGAGGSLNEMYNLYLENNLMFNDNNDSIVVNNSTYLLNTVIPNELNSNSSEFNRDHLTEMTECLHTLHSIV